MADAEIAQNWPEEPIAVAEVLYMRVHRSFVSAGQLQVGVFRDQGDNMSTDWQKYATPAETRARAKVPADNGVIAMVAGDIANIDGLSVRHRPDIVRQNRAHTGVIGDKSPRVRLLLGRVYKWVPGFELAL